MERLPELGVLSHSVAIAADGHQMTVMDETIDERGRHDVIAEDVTPVLEALVGREHGRRVLVATRHQLKKEHGTRAADG